MWRCRKVAVARVFALVVRCWIIRLVLYSRVGKNRDTSGSPPAVPGAARTAGQLTVLFSQKVLAVRKAMTYTDLLAHVILKLLSSQLETNLGFFVEVCQGCG